MSSLQPQSDQTERIGMEVAVEEPLATYRPINRCALLAFLLALLSPLALVSVLLWTAPLVALVLAGIGWRQTARFPEAYSGARLAKIATALALLFLAAALTRHYSRQWWLFARARRNAEQVIELIRQGRGLDLHQLSLYQNERRPEGMPFEEYYRRMEMKQMADGFLSAEPLKTLLEHRQDGRFRFVRYHALYSTAKLDQVTLQYEFTWTGQSQQEETIPVFIVLERSVNSVTGNVQWRLDGIQSAPPDRR